MAKKKDHGLDTLLLQNGDHYFIDDYQVFFTVKRVAVTEDRPHGISYSLVLLDSKNQRIVGFDNAHSVTQGTGPGKKRSKQYDHKHIRKKVTPYNYKDAGTLMQDFWKEVDKIVET